MAGNDNNKAARVFKAVRGAAGPSQETRDLLERFDEVCNDGNDNLEGKELAAFGEGASEILHRWRAAWRTKHRDEG